MAAAFRKQGRIFVGKLGALRDKWPVQEAAEIPSEFSEWELFWMEASNLSAEAMVNPIVRARSTALMMGGESLAQALNMAMTFDLANPLAVARVRDYGAKLVSNVNETTKGYIRTIIGNGLEGG